MTQPADQADLHRHQRQALRAVALVECVKGFFVLLMGVCALLLVHQDVWLFAEGLLALFHINPDRHFALVFLNYADDVTDARLWAAARIAFAYSALRFAEAYGLWRQRAWAEWVACVSGALLLPFEVRELVHRVSLPRIALFLGNLAIVLYMLYVLRTGHRERHKHASASASEPRARSHH
jgi:uncharacterized membrane protein (DUF2068 family)